MQALQITSMKLFMNRLLAGDSFDTFLLEEAAISTAVTYTIDGRINVSFYPPDERNSEHIPYPFQPWSELRGLCFNLIKGRHTPLNFKFVFHLKPELALKLLSVKAADSDFSQLKALVLTIRYDGTRAVLTTGTAYHTFILSKEADLIWDKAFQKYLSDCGITFEALQQSAY